MMLLNKDTIVKAKLRKAGQDVWLGYSRQREKEIEVPLNIFMRAFGDVNIEWEGLFSQVEVDHE